MSYEIPGAPDTLRLRFRSREEAAYREWYLVRYHSPADDLKQPWDPGAAAKFNDFFGRLVETIANASERPRWKSTSKFAPRN